MVPHAVAIAVFCFCFFLVTLAGFFAGRWRRADLNSLEEWGLAGRKFGTLITWFLIGGDFYTAYTVIAVPAALYGTGAPGFFAIPYCILLYPYMMVVLPRLWNVCHRHGYITLADFAKGRHGSRALSIALALTGILATMPYIALQLVGMREVIAALGINGEWPLVAAFMILAAYTYTSGLRAPAAIAIVKDTMLYIMVLAAVVILPAKLGGYGHIFATAGASLATHKPAASVILKPSQYLSYSTLALGSAIALVLYPHTATGVLSAGSGRIIKRNAALMPAYNVLLALIALLGYMAIAAGIHTADTSSAVPLLFVKMFPEWFAGFCLAAIGIGALVPAAIMSIAASNLFTRNLYGELRRTPMTPHQESANAKLVSLFLKFGALAFVLFVKTQYAIELQLLGGIWIAQLFPAIVLGLFTRWFHARGLFWGWAAGMATGTSLALARDLKSSVYPFQFGTHVYAVYAAIPALLVNLVVAVAVTLLLNAMGTAHLPDQTQPGDYLPLEV
ncbi:SSS family solute:Na+ symporter [Silvibacterium bohemicum]|uniref:SSS family solute:Na+ symporter n=1 Tax=Silvibacterium bohemicum TaxID=1577686 RepID=A0A841JZY5_9BACT|nr:sodium:solute symporter family protein [Silvibacterium bohemicum]MBB6146235.1 SSS family solute:Na+ symporter [Silvibacterium bohemicum]